MFLGGVVWVTYFGRCWKLKNVSLLASLSNFLPDKFKVPMGKKNQNIWSDISLSCKGTLVLYVLS